LNFSYTPPWRRIRRKAQTGHLSKSSKLGERPDHVKVGKARNDA
jgi:hypothetical protein